ncbi:ribonuclease H-like domain-containing protein [Tanacetum coccineum]
MVRPTSRYKARLVANGSTQLAGIDVDETFSPVVKPATIRTVLSLAISRHWPVHQLDVKNAFFKWIVLRDCLHVHTPGFGIPLASRSCLPSPDLFMGLNRPLAWFQRFAAYAARGNFVTRNASRCFIFNKKYATEFLDRAVLWASLGVLPMRWLKLVVRNLLRELHTPLATATLVYCDNVSAVYLSSNPVQHQRTKHIEIDIHFVRDLVATGAIRVLHVPSRYQYADIFTKGLPTSLFDEFRTSLSVRSSPAPTAGGC